MVKSSYPLEKTVTLALTAGVGSTSMTPALRGEVWQVSYITCSLINDTAPVRMDVAVNGVRLAGTYSARSDTSDSTYSVLAGQLLSFAWSPSTAVIPAAGAVATVTVRGTRSLP